MRSRAVLGAVALALSLYVMAFAGGCVQHGNAGDTREEGPGQSEASTEVGPSGSESVDDESLGSGDEAENTEEQSAGWQDEPTMDAVQLNSLAMLNHLAVVAERIEASKGSRVALEEIYSSLLNNTYPGAVDGRTLEHLEVILDTLDDFRMVDAKRERLAYLYEQSKAQAMRDAQSDQASVFSVVGPHAIITIPVSIVADMAVDAISSYGPASELASYETLFDEWEFSDEESAHLHQLKKETFGYMVETVGDYELQGDLALSEEAVERFVSWSGNDNAVRRVQFLEDNEGIYRAYGGYWLALAKGYFELEMLNECLSAIESYESLEIDIFRRDTEYAAVLPLAITAAAETMASEEYVAYAEERAALLLSNCSLDDWSSRYFVAQVYVDLAARTEDEEHLSLAYDIVLNNVNELVDVQLGMNEEYISEFVGVEVSEIMPEEQKKSIKEYNKMCKEVRKTELPPAYMPLLLNCELLLALADELDIPEAEMSKIDRILHQDGKPAFLTVSLDERFCPTGAMEDAGTILIEAGGTRLSMPATLVNELSKVEMLVNGELVPGAWTVKKVNRSEGDDLSAFRVQLENGEAKGRFSDGDEVVVRIDNQFVTSEHRFKALVNERFWIVPDAIEFKPAT